MIWKDVVWYEWIYQVSDQWVVRSVTRTVKSHWKFMAIRKWKLISPCKLRDWYLGIWLVPSTGVKYRKMTSVHRIVAIAFLGNRTSEWLEINHINWIKNDNRLENLERVTRSYNQIHARKLWLRKPRQERFWKDHRWSKKVYQYEKSWELIRERDCVREAGRELWFFYQNICACCHNRTHSSNWYVRSYEKLH